MSLTEEIKEKARELGFQLVGVTTPEPPPHYAIYEGWLAAGRHGEMAYLASERARQRRGDPRLILPECRSILVLGVRYPAPTLGFSPFQREGQGGMGGDRSEPSTETASPRGRVASYAWGQDYHDVLAQRLRTLVVFIETQAGGPVPSRWYTDTGPLLERDLAQRAGLGWIGKNTCLIDPRQGSYFLLAEVLLGLELEPDPPFLPDYCGSCTRCIDACPTACILPDRTLDARRCISYLTIELKGDIPEGLRPQMGDWVFGCDICQQVCPWNVRFAVPQGDPAFAPRPDVPSPVLIEEMALDSQSFNRKFKGSPLKRARRRGYLRNAAVALGNHRHPAAVPALAGALSQDADPLVRRHSAWALGRTGGEAALHALRSALLSEADETVRAEIRAALIQT
jgi:epoxyqueuosine reductase